MGESDVNPAKLFQRKSPAGRSEQIDPVVIVQATGLTPMGQFDGLDVFICGYPKSGNTWFQNLIAGVVFGCDGEYASDPLIQMLVPDVSDLKFYRRFQTPMFFKTHLLPQKAYRRIVHLLRDGRDVMVSYYHHLCALAGTEVSFMDVVRSGEGLFPCKWHEHAEAYFGLEDQSRRILIRYEDLITDTIGQLRRFCQFVEIERPESVLRAATDKASFGVMRNKENTPLWTHPPQWKDRSKLFVRRGVVGSYKDEMPSQVLAAFEEEAGPMLRKSGYL
jgi:Sulfotransferase domain